MRILLVDDHAVVRRGLIQILEDSLRGAEIAEASTGQEALTRAAEGNWDIIVLDISLPDINGLEVLKRIKAENHQARVLVLSIYSEDQYGVRMMKAGAAGYLTKATAPENLVAAVKKVVSGGRYVSRALTEKVAFDVLGDSENNPHERLSDREYQIFHLLASGESVSEVARELSLSVKTVSTHRQHILEKMNLQTNADLIRYAFQHELIN